VAVGGDTGSKVMIGVSVIVGVVVIGALSARLVVVFTMVVVSSVVVVIGALTVSVTDVVASAPTTGRPRMLKATTLVAATHPCSPAAVWA
jgi:uncharacterized membrane protein